jgi:hypothetical protein
MVAAAAAAAASANHIQAIWVDALCRRFSALPILFRHLAGAATDICLTPAPPVCLQPSKCNEECATMARTCQQVGHSSSPRRSCQLSSVCPVQCVTPATRWEVCGSMSQQDTQAVGSRLRGVCNRMAVNGDWTTAQAAAAARNRGLHAAAGMERTVGGQGGAGVGTWKSKPVVLLQLRCSPGCALLAAGDGGT